MIPESIAEKLKIHLQIVKILHQQDLKKGYGSVYLPFALERKYPIAKYVCMNFEYLKWYKIKP